MITILLSSSQAFGYPIFDLTPQNYFLFDATNNVTLDSTGGLNGILENGASWNSAGHTGGTLHLDGRDDFFRVSHNDALNLAEEGSIRAWIYYNRIHDFDGIVSKGTASDWSDETYNLQLWNGGKVAGIINNDTTYDIVKSNISLSRNTWYYIVFRWNSTTLALDIDGQNVGSVSNTIGLVRTNPSDVIIGCQVEGDYCPKGYIDDVAIWNKSLTDAEIAADYAISTSTYVPACGNGFIDAGELCDDGNTLDGDSCSSDCNNVDCNDTDADGVCDSEDICLTTPFGEGVNNDGCSCSEIIIDPITCENSYCINNTYYEYPSSIVPDCTDGVVDTSASCVISFVESNSPRCSGDEIQNKLWYSIYDAVHGLLERMGVVEAKLNSTDLKTDLLLNQTQDIKNSLNRAESEISDVKTIVNNSSSSLDDLEQKVDVLTNTTELLFNATNASLSKEVNLSETNGELSNINERLDNQTNFLTNFFSQVVGLFDNLSNQMTTEHNALEDNLTHQLDKINFKLDNLTLKQQQIYTYVTDISFRSNLTYDKLSTIEPSVYDLFNYVHDNITAIISESNNLTQDAMLSSCNDIAFAFSSLEGLINNSDLKRETEFTQLFDSFTSLYTLVNNSQSSGEYDDEFALIFSKFIDLESDLREVNNTILQEIDYQVNDLNNSLVQVIQNDSNLVLSDLVLINEKLLSLNYSDNFASLENTLANNMSYVTSLLFTHQEKLFDVESLLIDFNASESARYDSLVAEDHNIFDTLFNLQTDLDVEFDNLSLNVEDLFNNISTSNDLIDNLLLELGYENNSVSLYDQIVELIGLNNNIIHLANEINLTTHLNSDYLVGLGNSLNSLQTNLLGNVSFLLDTYHTQTRSELLAVINDMGSDLYLFNASYADMFDSLSLQFNDRFDSLETVVSNLTFNISSGSVTNDTLSQDTYDLLLELESDLLGINVSLTHEIQTGFLDTQSLFVSGIQNLSLGYITEFNNLSFSLMNITTDLDAIQSNQTLLFNDVSLARDQLIGLEDLIVIYGDKLTLDVSDLESNMTSLIDNYDNLLTSIGYENQSVSLRDDILSLLFNTSKIFLLTKEINMTTHSTESYVSLFEQEMSNMSSSLLLSFSDIVESYSNTSNDILLEAIDNASLDVSLLKNISSLVNASDEITNKLSSFDSSFSDIKLLIGSSLSNLNDSLLESFYEIKLQLFALNTSLTQEMQLQSQATVSSLTSVIRNKISTLSSDLIIMQNSLFDLSYGQDNLNASLNTISTQLDSQLLSISELSNWLDEFNDTDNNRFNNISNELDVVVDYFTSTFASYNQTVLLNNLSLLHNLTSSIESEIITLKTQIGYGNTSQSMRDDILSILLMNGKLLTITQEINLTTHSSQDQLDALGLIMQDVYNTLHDELLGTIESYHNITSEKIDNSLSQILSELSDISNVTSTYSIALLNDLHSLNTSFDSFAVSSSQSDADVYDSLIQLESLMRKINVSLSEKIQFTANQSTDEILFALSNNITSVVDSFNDINLRLDNLATISNDINLSQDVLQTTLYDTRDKLFAFETYLSQLNDTQTAQFNSLTSDLSGLETLFVGKNNDLIEQYNSLQDNLTLVLGKQDNIVGEVNTLLSTLGFEGLTNFTVKDYFDSLISVNNELILLSNEINLTTHNIDLKVDLTYSYIRDTIFPIVSNLETNLLSLDDEHEMFWEKLVNISSESKVQYENLTQLMNNQNNSLSLLESRLLLKLSEHESLLLSLNKTSQLILQSLLTDVVPHISQTEQSLLLIQSKLETLNNTIVTDSQGEQDEFSNLFNEFNLSINTISNNMADLSLDLYSLDNETRSSFLTLFETLDTFSNNINNISCSGLGNSTCGLVADKIIGQIEDLIDNSSNEMMIALDLLSGEVQTTLNNLTMTSVGETINFISDNNFNENKTSLMSFMYKNQSGLPLSYQSCSILINDLDTNNTIVNDSLVAYSQGVYSYSFTPESSGNYMIEIQCNSDYLFLPITVQPEELYIESFNNYNNLMLNQFDDIDASMQTLLTNVNALDIPFLETSLSDLEFYLSDMNATTSYFMDDVISRLDDFNLSIIDLLDNDSTLLGQMSLLESNQNDISHEILTIKSQVETVSNLVNTSHPEFEDELTLLYDELYDLHQTIYAFNYSYSERLGGLQLDLESLINNQTTTMITSFDQLDSGFKSYLDEAIQNMSLIIRENISTELQVLSNVTTGFDAEVMDWFHTDSDTLTKLLVDNGEALAGTQEWLSLFNESVQGKFDLFAQYNDDVFNWISYLNDTNEEDRVAFESSLNAILLEIDNINNISSETYGTLLSLNTTQQNMSMELYQKVLDLETQNLHVIQSIVDLNATVGEIGIDIEDINAKVDTIIVPNIEQLVSDIDYLTEEYDRFSLSNVETILTHLNDTVSYTLATVDYFSSYTNDSLKNMSANVLELMNNSNSIEESFTELSNLVSAHLNDSSNCHDDSLVLDTFGINLWNTSITNASIESIKDVVRIHSSLNISRNVTLINYSGDNGYDVITRNVTYPNLNDYNSILLRARTNQLVSSSLVGIGFVTDNETYVYNLPLTDTWREYSLDISYWNLSNVKQILFYMNMENQPLVDYKLYLDELDASSCHASDSYLVLEELLNVKNNLVALNASLTQTIEEQTNYSITELKSYMDASLTNVRYNLSSEISNLYDIIDGWDMLTVEELLANTSSLHETMLDISDLLVTFTENSNNTLLLEKIDGLSQQIVTVQSKVSYNKALNNDIYDEVKNLLGDTRQIMYMVNDFEVPRIIRINLKKGVNRFIMSKDLSDQPIDSLLKPIADELESVAYYEPALDKWLIYNPNVNYGNTLHYLAYNNEYWFQMKDDATLQI